MGIFRSRLLETLFIGVLFFWPIAPSFSQDDIPVPKEDQVKPYSKQSILDARFGSKEWRELIAKVYELEEIISKRVVGQEHMAKILKLKFRQYLESLGSRTKEPVALHMIGLPGVGKSMMLNLIKLLGFEVLLVDAQKFVADDGQRDISWELFWLMQAKVNAANSKNKPLIVLFDEIDKVPEIRNGKAVTQPLIGFLNEILTEGRVIMRNGSSLDFSNIMVLTAMNFSPEDLDDLVKEKISPKKTFYDLTEKDLEKMDELLRKSNESDASLGKTLGKFLRSNTVSRFLPDTVTAKPLHGDDYRRIIEIMIDNTIERLSQESSKKNRVKVEYSKEIIDFFVDKVVFSPTGARKTVKRMDFLIEQLIQFGLRLKLQEGNDYSLALPRKIVISPSNEENAIVLEVQAFHRKGSVTELVAAKTIDIRYDPIVEAFDDPIELTFEPPKVRLPKKNSNRITPFQIYQHRFGSRRKIVTGLKQYLDKEIYGQENFTTMIEEEMNYYLQALKPSDKPLFQIFSGFPGIGKTDLIVLLAKRLKLPVVKINLQEYAASSQEAADRFARDLMTKVNEAREKSKNGKYLLLIEEMDKTFEVNPGTGLPLEDSRPMISHIKNLLSDGKTSVSVEGFGTTKVIEVDIRDAYTFFTMNFGIDRFKFTADPRMTTIADIQAVINMLRHSPEELKSLLATLFLPETVNRLISPRFHVLNTLSKDSYEKLIQKQIRNYKIENFYHEGKNLAQIDLEFSERFLNDYVYSESVIPSEGGRQAFQASGDMIRFFIELAIKKMGRKHRLAKKPIVLSLDFEAQTESTSAQVVIDVREKKTREKERLYVQPVSLRFPPMKKFGAIPDLRMVISIHEFGHAFSAILMGLRVEYATSVSSKSNIGGFVKYRPDQSQSAPVLLSTLYSKLASRAMERILLSPEPRKSNSVLSIFSGASGDIQSASGLLWDLIYRYGMHPEGGTIERSGLFQGNYNARLTFLSELPDNKVEALGRILRDLENHMVDLFLRTHSKKWYVEKISEFAKEGGFSEKQLYDLVALSFPGENNIHLGEETYWKKAFEKRLSDLPEETKVALKQEIGDESRNRVDILNEAIVVFKNSVDHRLTEAGWKKPSSCEEGVNQRFN